MPIFYGFGSATRNRVPLPGVNVGLHRVKPIVEGDTASKAEAAFDSAAGIIREIADVAAELGYRPQRTLPQSPSSPSTKTATRELPQGRRIGMAITQPMAIGIGVAMLLAGFVIARSR